MDTAQRDKWSLSSPSSVFSPSSTPSSERFGVKSKQQAATERRRVWIKYEDGEGRITKRKIEIYCPVDNTYVFAWCCVRKEPRTFKIDNILEWKLLDERFEYNRIVDEYIGEQLVPKDWNRKIPWDQWIRSHQSRPSVSSPPLTPVAPKQEPACWVSPSQSITVQGYIIPSGGLYVGAGLRSVNGLHVAEPALIDPRLSIDRSNADKAGKNIPYWPSYSDLSPAARAGYLDWLSTARQNCDVHVGYPFLFFYGLERRLLASAAPLSHDKSELEFMRTELLRLLNVYNKIDSFRQYVTPFLEIVEMSRDKDRLYQTAPPMARVGDNLPTCVQAVVAQFAEADQPLPHDWALAWIVCHPEVRLRTPARRCNEELRVLFHVRYREEFGDGLKVRAGKGRLSIRYKPASPTFGKELVIATSLPDVPAFRSVPKKLADLVERCTDELEPYSRYVGTKGSEEGDLAKIALLPLELAKQHQGRACVEFRSWLERQAKPGQPSVVDSRELIGRWRIDTGERLSKNEGVLLAQLLEKWHCGLEPDVRFGGPPLRKDAKAVLFPLSQDAATTPSPEYAVATILVHVGVVVAMADGVFSADEEQRLHDHLQTALRIGDSERQRLHAHVQWLRTEQPSLSVLSKRLQTLNKGQKTTIAQFLVTLAGADGHIASEEVEALTKIYSILGFERERLYADIHGLSIPDDSSHADLVTVRHAELARTQYSIPKPNESNGRQGFSLDMTKVNAKLAETASVSALLGNIFTSDDVTMAAPSKGKAIGALDARQSDFLMALLNKESWDRSAIDELASTMNLLPDGALDAVNEACFELVGEPLWEGDDRIQVNLTLGKEMLTCQTN